MGKNLYQILQIDCDAELEVIKAAYLKLAAMYHPDQNTDPDANEYMKLLNIAYEILSNCEKRRQYDLELKSSKYLSHAKNSQEKSKEKIHDVKEEINSIKLERERLLMIEEFVISVAQSVLSSFFVKIVNHKTKRLFRDDLEREIETRISESYRIKYAQQLDNLKQEILQEIMILARSNRDLKVSEKGIEFKQKFPPGREISNSEFEYWLDDLNKAVAQRRKGLGLDKVQDRNQENNTLFNVQQEIENTLRTIDDRRRNRRRRGKEV